MVALGNGGRGSVDARMRLVVHISCNVVLAARVRDDLFVLQHEDVTVDQLVVSRGATKQVLRSLPRLPSPAQR